MSAGIYDQLRASLVSGEPVVLAEVTQVVGGLDVVLAAKVLVRAPGDVLGTLGSEELDRVVIRDALGDLERGISRTRHYGVRGQPNLNDVEVFFETFVVPARLIIFGAVDFTRALAEVAAVLGFHVIVCDARATFATSARFPSADEIIVEWPNRYLDAVGATLGPRDAICVLTHDAKFDVPAILGALASDVGYIGVMGSRRTHAQRHERLIEAGADPEVLATRVNSPIGLDLGARTPEETAVAIVAEIIAVHSGRANAPITSLSAGDGPIH